MQPCGICGIQCVFGRRQDDIVADVGKVSAAALEKKARRSGQFQGQNFRCFALCQGTGALLLAHDVLAQAQSKVKAGGRKDGHSSSAVPSCHKDRFQLSYAGHYQIWSQTR